MLENCDDFNLRFILGGKGNLESTLVDHALTSLPGMVGQVADKHKDHSDEIGKQQTILNFTKV